MTVKADGRLTGSFKLCRFGVCFHRTGTAGYSLLPADYSDSLSCLNNFTPSFFYSCSNFHLSELLLEIAMVICRYSQMFLTIISVYKFPIIFS